MFGLRSIPTPRAGFSEASNWPAPQPISSTERLGGMKKENVLPNCWW